MVSEYTKAYSNVIAKVMKSPSPQKQDFITQLALTQASIMENGWFGSQDDRNALMNLATPVGMAGDSDLDFVLRRSSEQFLNKRY